MIVLGLSSHQKEKEILSFIPDGVKKVFILSPKKFFFPLSLSVPHEWVEWNDIIEYVTFYRLLQEIDNQTLVVINECLRTQNRNDLTFNCIRHFLRQTKTVLVLQYLPIISSREDFMTLFDFDTKSQWKRQKFNPELVQSVAKVYPAHLQLNAIESETNSVTKLKYSKQKDDLFAQLGVKDPHTIPRNLYLLGGKSRLSSLGGRYSGVVARNTRIKAQNLKTYKDTEFDNRPYSVMEFPHDHINFSDFVYFSEQVEFDVAVSDLKVDHWYFERYQSWIEEINYVYSVIRQDQDGASRSERKDFVSV